MMNAVIISDGGAFAKMIEIELSMMGIATRYSDGSDASLLAELIVADLDYCERFDCSLLGDGYKIGYYTADASAECRAAERCDEILRRPFLTSHFRALVSQKFSSERKSADFFSVSIADSVPISQKKAPEKERLSLNAEKRAAIYGGREILLSELEYKTLACLFERRGETVMREEISSLLGGDGNMPEVYICHLRRKIDNSLGKKMIYTVRGKGYMIKA